MKTFYLFEHPADQRSSDNQKTNFVNVIHTYDTLTGIYQQSVLRT